MKGNAVFKEQSLWGKRWTGQNQGQDLKCIVSTKERGKESVKKGNSKLKKSVRYKSFP